jgi:hypothetical protein
VLAYETMPMFHALTGTRPYLRNAWPKLYDRQVLARELELALSEKSTLPVVIYQKVKTSGTTEWPDPDDDNSRFELGNSHNAAIRGFLDNHRYEMIWENIAFQVWLPPGSKRAF